MNIHEKESFTIETEVYPVDGFLFGAIHSGIKKKKKDLSLIVCPEGASVGATYTTNKTKAAPVVLSMQHMASPTIKAVVINSGNANACTGMAGYQNALNTAKLVASLCGAEPEEVLVSSTGVIGVPLPMACIEKGLPKVYKHLEAGKLNEVAEGIMTTDTQKKTFGLKVFLPGIGKEVTLSGIAKGSGMIHPNMATMLGFVMTDLAISQSLLQSMTKHVVEDTFNMVTVDGDTSTNDMFAVLASGALKNEALELHPLDGEIFKAALHAMAEALSISIAKDGEGASKLLTVKLKGAATDADAKKLAKSVVSSSLVKAAFFGMDANWGRIICALGYADAAFEPEHLTLALSSSGGTITLMEDGVGLAFDEAFALEVLKPEAIDILIELKDGESSAVAWGCDLTYDYVKINGAYRT